MTWFVFSHLAEFYKRQESSEKCNDDGLIDISAEYLRGDLIFSC